MLEVLYRATKYMNAEDAQSAQEEKPRKRERQDDTRQDQGPRRPKREIDETNVALSLRGEGLQASPH